MPITVAAGKNSAKKLLTTRVLTPNELSAVWPEIEPLLARAFEESLHELTPYDILQFAMLGIMTIFVAEREERVELACVAEVMRFPQYSITNIVAIGGKNLCEAARFFPALEAWALSMGTCEIRGSCPNEAIPRLYRRLGLPFTRAYTVIRYDLRGSLQ